MPPGQCTCTHARTHVCTRTLIYSTCCLKTFFPLSQVLIVLPYFYSYALLLPVPRVTA